jgi:hypothetical protein
MTTTNTRYVDPNAAAGGTGTTNALSGANCAYVSLAVWEAARQADLTSSDVIERCVCSSDDAGSTHAADTTVFDIDGWTTDATRYIQIEAASSHGGKWNDSIYRLAVASGSHAFSCTEEYLRIYGLQIYRNQNLDCIYTASALSGVWTLEKLILKKAGTDGACFRSNSTSFAGTVNIHNSILYDSPWVAFVARGASGATYNLRNCTFHNNTNGIYNVDSRTVAATNCGLAATVANAYIGTVTQTTCSTSAPTFVDEAGDDFHLAAADSTWKNAGTDLSATFTDDIDGETRPTGAGTWDIGCDEYVSASTVPIWLLKTQYIPALGGIRG